MLYLCRMLIVMSRIFKSTSSTSLVAQPLVEAAQPLIYQYIRSFQVPLTAYYGRYVNHRSQDVLFKKMANILYRL